MTAHGDFIYPKIVTEEWCRAAENGDIESTTIVPSGFLDWGLRNGFLGFDIPRRKVVLFDQGIHMSTGMTLDFLARCVVSVLRMPAESTRNRRIHVAEARFSGREVVEDVVGEKFEVVFRGTEELWEEARQGIWKMGWCGMTVGNSSLKENL